MWFVQDAVETAVFTDPHRWLPHPCAPPRRFTPAQRNANDEIQSQSVDRPFLFVV
jgi:hypothetical protein